MKKKEKYRHEDRCRELDEANFAYMNRSKIPVLCSRKKAWEWFHNGGCKRCQIKYDKLEEWNVSTRFCFSSNEPDGPPLFWEVSVWFSDGQYLHFRSGSTRFGALDEALFFHERLVENIEEFGEVLAGKHPAAPDGTVLLVPVIELKGLVPGDDEGDDEADWWKEESE